jgi:hypothetical protein
MVKKRIHGGNIFTFNSSRLKRKILQVKHWVRSTSNKWHHLIIKIGSIFKAHLEATLQTQFNLHQEANILKNESFFEMFTSHLNFFFNVTTTSIIEKIGPNFYTWQTFGNKFYQNQLNPKPFILISLPMHIMIP